MRYGRRYSGGTDASEGWGGGAPVVLAVAAYAGNTTADAALLRQISDLLAGGNESVADGGYTAQHERWGTGMLAIARQTPRIWARLSATEQPSRRPRHVGGRRGALPRLGQTGTRLFSRRRSRCSLRTRSRTSGCEQRGSPPTAAAA
jgi:hypothetical protein